MSSPQKPSNFGVAGARSAAVASMTSLSDSAIDALTAFRDMYIEYDQVNDVLARIADYHAIGRHSRNGSCMSLVGHSGTGKTSIVERYCRRFPQSNGNLPVLLVTLPSQCSVKNMCIQILLALGDPFAERKTTRENLETRVQHFMERRRVELVIFDEFQHLIDPNRSRLVIDATEWLKAQINRLRKPFLLVGLPEFEQVLEYSDQWRRRLESRLQIEPFSTETDRHAEQYIDFLTCVSEHVPFKGGHQMLEGDIPERLLLVSGGRVAFLMRLIQKSVERGLRAGSNVLAVEHFRSAYDELEPGETQYFGNLFGTDRSKRLPPIPSSHPPNNRRQEGRA